MIGAIIKATLLIQFLHSIAEVTGQVTPCPNYFRYIRDDTTNEVMGFIEIPSAPRGVALQLSVSMSIAVALPTKYVGGLELAQSKRESVRAVQQGRPLQYRIHFPLRRPIPFLTGLWFNSQQICTGPRAVGPIVTSIVLNHSLFPPGITPPPDDEDEFPQQTPRGPDIVPTYQTPKPTRTPRPTQPPKPTRPPPPVYTEPPESLMPETFFNPSNVFTSNQTDGQEECGKTITMNQFANGHSSKNNINLLIAKGEKTSQGQWPWLAAIFIIKLEFEFQCAGSLVTNTHIVTAAHCFQLGKINVPAGAMLVSLGRYRLRNWREEGSVNREVAEYRFHPDYNSRDSADADIAILVLRESVEYSHVIKPICLWSGPTELEKVIGKYGYVVGWGRDELGNPYLQEPRVATVPIVPQADCHWSNSNFVTFTSNRTFCAGQRNGSGPCNGDSGSGLVIYDSKTERYVLRGVVSRSLLDSNTMSCDLTQYVVYVDVAKHLDWVRQQVSAA